VQKKSNALLKVSCCALLTGLSACGSSSTTPTSASTSAVGSGTAVTTSAVAPTTNISIKVSGDHFVDIDGNTVQLRGVNVSGLETVAIEGWSPSDPWGGQQPNFTAIKSWGANAIRLPLNEASWRGGTCVDEGGSSTTVVNGKKVQDTPGQTIQTDPGSNYQATVEKTISQAAAAGLYVILDLHFTAPGNGCPVTQTAMADADHSVAFWSSVATTFKSSPSVIFELFNEPFLDQTSLQDKTPWADLINGQGTISSYTVMGNPGTVSYTWNNAGMQQMLNAIRATGATNVILTSTLAYSSSMGGWLEYHPIDTLSPSQVGAVWHAYPNSGGSSLVDCIGTASTCSPADFASVQSIIAAGYPVVITEFGDSPGGTTAPLSATLLPWADANGVNYMAWTWNAWVGSTFYLITDTAGDPSAGFGTYVKAHYQCRAAGTAVCP
jgi:endoglucanase